MVIFHSYVSLPEGIHPIPFPRSMDWFKGKITGKPHIYWENLYGFRLRFSLKPIHSQPDRLVHHLDQHPNHQKLSHHHHMLLHPRPHEAGPPGAPRVPRPQHLPGGHAAERTRRRGSSRHRGEATRSLGFFGIFLVILGEFVVIL